MADRMEIPADMDPAPATPHESGPASEAGPAGHEWTEERRRPRAASTGGVGAVADLEAELARRDRRLAELERACRSAVKERELATALAGRPLVPGAAGQLIRLWRDDLDVSEGESGYEVVARDGRTVAQAVSEWLASPEYSHFCQPSSRGGTASRDASRPADRQGAPAAPRNLGEAVVMRWREESTARGESLSRPIGLRRHR